MNDDDLLTGWRGTDGDTEPVKFLYRAEEWGRRTATGDSMSSNTHFKAEEEAWKSIRQSVSAGVKLAGHHVLRERETLARIEKQAADAAVEYLQAETKYREWLAKQGGNDVS
jgi:hypothetical protein